jgi:hypothetical protein
MERHSSRWIAPGLTAAAALVRLAPHPWNFTPVESMAIYGGARLAGWQAWVLPLAAMALTDPIASWMMGGYPAYSWMTVVIYACLLFNVLLGRKVIGSKKSVARIGAATLTGSTVFFLVTNLFVWLGAPLVMYPRTLAGLEECYAAGLPFFGWTLAGNLFYAGVFFMVDALLRRYTGAQEPVASIAR